jgi:ferredoxin-NADP reductase
MVHTDTDIRLTAIALRPETPGYLSLILERPRGFEFEAGDWVDIDFVGRDLQGGKTYSLSSSPTEQNIMITFKEGISPFKKALASAAAGDKLVITQYGNDYDFHVRCNRSSVLIAGGVGIAPFRSMLKDMADGRLSNDVLLVYQNKTNDFLFKNELDAWQQHLPNLSVLYMATGDMKKKERNKALTDALDAAGEYYFIAGPEGMVHSTLKLLEECGADTRNIRVDSFGGY